ncbi:hypothetical protein LJY25_14745 [Hymenobacter sp. BT175]|uniref:hypothetical protein n=1 Tax=Hymenobacter translucens TaxID=2886507 RepID=UPI001D0E1897|nr:hypothetical protein [Hymenobacter translucens]MCC2547711.1 hypothetical protein [Hymenobacter translucens]
MDKKKGPKPTAEARSARPETASAPRAAETAALPTASEEKSVPAEVKAQSAKKSDTVKVKVLRSHPEFGYFVGDEGTISREAFDRIQKDGPFFKQL